MKKNETAFASCMGIVAMFVATIIVSTIVNGWTLSLLWLWFIAPIFGWPGLSIAQAIGISMVVSFLTRHSISQKDENKDIYSIIGIALTNIVIYPIVVITIGYVVTLFL